VHYTEKNTTNSEINRQSPESMKNNASNYTQQSAANIDSNTTVMSTV